MLDVRRLRVLHEVARRGSLAAAAEALSYSPSAVSQQIAALEREAGARVLERQPRGIVLTDAGRVLVEHAARILEELEAAENALGELTELRRGRLRMAAFPTAAARVLPEAVDRFRARHPDVGLHVEQANPADTVALLRSGRLDVALTLDWREADASGVEIVELFEDPVQLAVHESHPLAGRTVVALSELAGETWIDVPAWISGGNLLRAAAARAGFEPEVAYESDDYAVIRELVAAGVGVALIPELALSPRSRSVVTCSLGADAPRRLIQAATRPAAVRAPAATAMLDILLEVTAPQRAKAGAEVEPSL